MQLLYSEKLLWKSRWKSGGLHGENRTTQSGFTRYFSELLRCRYPGLGGAGSSAAKSCTGASDAQPNAARNGVVSCKSTHGRMGFSVLPCAARRRRSGQFFEKILKKRLSKHIVS